MEMVRQVIVFDGADLEAESTFWAGISAGTSSGTTGFTASSTPPAIGMSAYSSRRTTRLPTGRMALALTYRASHV
jgi:hypothetical protein